jgi:hypothetical protein
MMGTVKVFDVSPGAKLSVPTTVAKSQRPNAWPCLVAQPTVKVSVSAVRYSILDGPLVLPLRVTVIEALPPPSFTRYTEALN